MDYEKIVFALALIVLIVTAAGFFPFVNWVSNSLQRVLGRREEGEA